MLLRQEDEHKQDTNKVFHLDEGAHELAPLISVVRRELVCRKFSKPAISSIHSHLMLSISNSNSRDNDGDNIS